MTVLQMSRREFLKAVGGLMSWLLPWKVSPKPPEPEQGLELTEPQAHEFGFPLTFPFYFPEKVSGNGLRQEHKIHIPFVRADG